MAPVPGPRLVVFSGLPGVGKSTIAREVARALGAIWLRVDTVEAGLLKSGLRRSFKTGLAAYVVAGDLADDRLQLGGDVVIDAVNAVEPARKMWRELATARAARLTFVEVACADPEEHRRRLASRGLPTPPLPAPSWEEVEAVAHEYLPWDEPVVRLEATRPLFENVRTVLRAVGGASAPPEP